MIGDMSTIPYFLLILIRVLILVLAFLRYYKFISLVIIIFYFNHESECEQRLLLCKLRVCNSGFLGPRSLN